MALSSLEVYLSIQLRSDTLTNDGFIGLGVFSNLIIASFGYTTLQTDLLNIAQGALTILVMVGSAWLSEKLGQTILVMHVWTV